MRAGFASATSRTAEAGVPFEQYPLATSRPEPADPAQLWVIHRAIGLGGHECCPRRGFTCGWRIANQPRNPLRLSSLVILGVVARMSRCATRSSYWFT